MSATAATARYVIAADDRTKSAIASAQQGFRSLESGVSAGIRRMNLALGILAGVGLKRAFQNVFTETAKNSKEFAGALEDVRSAARDLLSSKDGAPAATAAMQELAETLKDPAVVAAADAITSSLISGFARATTFIAEATVGLQVLFGATSDEVENLNHQIERIDATLANRRASLPGAAGLFAKQLRDEIERLQAERDALLALQATALDRGPESRGRTFGFDTSLPGGLPGFELRDIDLAGEISKALKEFQRLENINPIDHLQEQLQDFVKTLQSDIKAGISETAQRAADDVQGVANRVEAAMEKAKASAAIAEEFQRSMFNNVSDLIFSAGDGWDNFADRAIDSFKRILADQATLQLFNFLAGAGGKSGGFGSFFSSLFGVGGGASGLGLADSFFAITKADTGIKRVPRDNQPFLLHKDEAVLPASMNPYAGGSMGTARAGVTVINNNTFNNVRDVSDAKLAVAGKQISDITIGRIRELQRQGQF